MPKIFTDGKYANLPLVCGFYIGSLELLWWNTGVSICFGEIQVSVSALVEYMCQYLLWWNTGVSVCFSGIQVSVSALQNST
jgi:hypothetical protein